MKKRMMSILLLATMVTGLIAGCGSTKKEAKNDDDDVVTVTWMTSRPVDGEIDQVMHEIADQYSKEKGGKWKIEFETTADRPSYLQKLKTLIAGGNMPDIIDIDADPYCQELVDAGMLVDVKQFLKDNDRYDDFYPIALKYQEFTDGSMYTLPLEYHVEMTWYNKEIFEENNVELPKTFDEFLDVCTTFQNAGVTPLAAGLKSWEPLLKSSMAFVTAEYLSTDEGKGFGEKYRNGEVTMDGTWNPYIETWSQLIDNGVYTADMTGIDHDQALEQFATGGSAMFCSGPWDYDAIMEKNPELQLDMMPFYGTKESAGWLIGGPGCGFAANASSKNLDAVKKVLAAISTTDGQNALWQNNQGGSSYLNGVEFDLPEAYTSVAGALAAGNVYCPWNEWGSAAGAHETYGTEMQSYLLGAQDLSTTLQTVDEVVSELLSK